MIIRSYIDGPDAGGIAGWVYNAADPSRALIVEAHIDGALVGVACANLSRPDVAASDHGKLRCGFFVPIDYEFEEQGEVEITIVLANTDIQLKGSPVRLKPSVISLSDRSASFRGSIDLIDGLRICGWVYDKDNRIPTKVRFSENGRFLVEVTADQFRQDVARLGPEFAECAFEAWLPISLADGQDHQITIETAEGRAVPGSPISVCVPIRGTRAALSLIAATPDNEVRQQAIAALDHYLALAQRILPSSVPLDSYEAWAGLFMVPHRTFQLDNAPPFAVMVNGGSDLVNALATLNSLQGAEAVQGNVMLIVDPAAWNDAAVDLRTAISRHIGKNVVTESEFRPYRAFSRLALQDDAFVLQLEAGDLLRSFALSDFRAALESDIDVAYSDWEGPGDSGLMPHFLPDWNHHYLLSVDYLGPMFAFRAKTVSRSVLPSDTWADVRLRAIEAARPGAVRHIPRVMGYAPRSLGSGLPRAALKAHLARIGLQAELGSHSSVTGAWSLSFSPPTPLPLVSIIIPTRDRVDLLRPCVETLLARTSYPELEIILVDNGSREPDTLKFFTEIATRGIMILRDEKPFNYSALNNGAVMQSHGSILGFVNNDIVVPHNTDPNWLHRIVGRLAVPDVASVGVKLVYPSALVQHAGIVVGVNGLAENAFKHLHETEAGYGARATVASEFSAVTAAAMFVRRDAFELAGGFDAVDLPVAFNDVDLCLKFRERGQRVVLDPEIKFFHLESASRGLSLNSEAAARDERERRMFTKRWAKTILCDPYYNANLNLDKMPFRGLAFPPRGWTPG